MAPTAEAAVVEAIAAPVTQLKPSTVAKHTEPMVDKANLLIIDHDPLEKSGGGGGKKGKSGYDKWWRRWVAALTPPLQFRKNLDDSVLLSLARDNTQYLFNELWTLPTNWVEQAICAKVGGITCHASPLSSPIHYSYRPPPTCCRGRSQ